MINILLLVSLLGQLGQVIGTGGGTGVRPVTINGGSTAVSNGGGGSSFSSISVDAIISMNTSSPGTTLTGPIIQAGTVSTNCSTAGCAWGVSGSGQTVGGNQAMCGNLGSVIVRNGSTFTAGTLAFNSISQNAADNFSFSAMSINAGVSTNVTISGCIFLAPANITPSGDAYDLVRSQDQSGHLAIVQLNNGNCGGIYGIRVHSDSSSSSCIAVSSGQTIWYSLNHNIAAGLNTLHLYSTGGIELSGSPVTVAVISGSSWQLVILGNDESGMSTGNILFSNTMFDWTSGANPLFWSAM